jgi:hypothetical protein
MILEGDSALMSLSLLVIGNRPTSQFRQGCSDPLVELGSNLIFDTLVELLGTFAWCCGNPSHLILRQEPPALRVQRSDGGAPFSARL